MKTATEEDYQRLINIGQSMLKNTHEHWHEIPVERLPVARFGQGVDSLFVAVGHLLLGEVKQARDWFAISGQFFLEASKPPDSVMSEKRALECALFSGDADFQQKIARQILPREGRVKPAEYPYVMFLKHTILNEPVYASPFLDESVWLSRVTVKQRGGYGTLRAACLALEGRRPDEFAAALEALLKEHTMKTAHGDSKMPDGMVCFPGAALLILAKQQGLDVQVTSPFLPPALFA